MREAEQHGDDAVAPISPSDTERVSTVPFTQLGFASPRMPTPLGGGVDINVEIEDAAPSDDAADGGSQEQDPPSTDDER